MKRNKLSPVQITFAHLMPEGKMFFYHPELGWLLVSPTGHHEGYLQGVDDALLCESTPVRLLRPTFYIPPAPVQA